MDDSDKVLCVICGCHNASHIVSLSGTGDERWVCEGCVKVAKTQLQEIAAHLSDGGTVRVEAI